MIQILDHSKKTYKYDSSVPKFINQFMEFNKEGFYKPESWLIRNGYTHIGFERRMLKQIGKLTELNQK